MIAEAAFRFGYGRLTALVYEIAARRAYQPQHHAHAANPYADVALRPVSVLARWLAGT